LVCVDLSQNLTRSVSLDFLGTDSVALVKVCHDDIVLIVNEDTIVLVDSLSLKEKILFPNVLLKMSWRSIVAINGHCILFQKVKAGSRFERDDDPYQLKLVNSRGMSCNYMITLDSTTKEPVMTSGEHFLAVEVEVVTETNHEKDRVVKQIGILEMPKTNEFEWCPMKKLEIDGAVVKNMVIDGSCLRVVYRGDKGRDFVENFRVSLVSLKDQIVRYELNRFSGCFFHWK
jgi:hypothetical protein